MLFIIAPVMFNCQMKNSTKSDDLVLDLFYSRASCECFVVFVYIQKIYKNEVQMICFSS